MTGPYAERIRVLEAQLKDADKAHAKTLFEYHEMKARAEAAEKERDRLRENLAICYGSLTDADHRIKSLEAKP